MTRNNPSPAEVAHLLIVDQDRMRAQALVGELGGVFALPPKAIAVQGGRAATEVLRAGNFDVLALDLPSLSDICASPEDGVAKLVKVAGHALTIALSESGSVSTSLAAMRAGAHDVVQRPVDGATFAGRLAALAQRHGRTWSFLPVETSSDHGMSAMLLSAGAALRSVAGSPKRPAVLPMWQQEQRIIEDAIASFAGNITLAAQALELNPSTIYRKRQAWAEMETAAKGAA
jgi:DNA-binding NtrC family response regulator